MFRNLGWPDSFVRCLKYQYYNAVLGMVHILEWHNVWQDKLLKCLLFHQSCRPHLIVNTVTYQLWVFLILGYSCWIRCKRTLWRNYITESILPNLHVDDHFDTRWHMSRGHTKPGKENMTIARHNITQSWSKSSGLNTIYGWYLAGVKENKSGQQNQ